MGILIGTFIGIFMKTFMGILMGIFMGILMSCYNQAIPKEGLYRSAGNSVVVCCRLSPVCPQSLRLGISG